MSNVLTPTSVGRYTTGVGHTGSSSYSNGLPVSLQKYNNNSSVNDNIVSGIRSGISAAAQAAANSMTSNSGQLANSLASNIAGVAGTDTSDYGEYLRQALELSKQNTAQSQAFAREQMEYQQKSDATAMAWSAAEAQKNRDWQEELSNTAHQREVRDLIAAGLNPILAANGGAYTGSGATGQAFSSSGASGQVDTSASGIMGSIANAIINTASQAAITKMYTDTERYSADMNYAASKLQADTQIYNEHSRNEANKILTQMNNDADVAKAQIGASATVSAAGANAAAIRDSASIGAAASRYVADKNSATNIYNKVLDASTERYKADKNYDLGKYQADTKNMLTNPVGYVAGVGNLVNEWLGKNQSGANNKAWNIHINDYE